MEPKTVAEYHKLYYLSHKKHISKLMARKTRCDVCGIELVASHYNRHLKTKRHLDKINY